MQGRHWLHPGPSHVVDRERTQGSDPNAWTNGSIASACAWRGQPTGAPLWVTISSQEGQTRLSVGWVLMSLPFRQREGGGEDAAHLPVCATGILGAGEVGQHLEYPFTRS